MSIFKKIRKMIHKVDPVSKAIDKKIGNVDKKKSTPTKTSGTPSSKGSAGGTGPQTQDMGSRPYNAGGAGAMSTARKITAGSRSGVGRLQKTRLK